MTVAACGSAPPDYSSVWTTPATTTTTAAPTTTDKPQPIVEFLYGHQVVGEQIPLDKLTDITVTLLPPPGWTKHAKSNFSPGTEVIAKKGTDSMATVVVLKLNGNFDVGEALTARQRRCRSVKELHQTQRLHRRLRRVPVRR